MGSGAADMETIRDLEATNPRRYMMHANNQPPKAPYGAPYHPEIKR